MKQLFRVTFTLTQPGLVAHGTFDYDTKDGATRHAATMTADKGYSNVKYVGAISVDNAR